MAPPRNQITKIGRTAKAVPRSSPEINTPTTPAGIVTAKARRSELSQGCSCCQAAKLRALEPVGGTPLTSRHHGFSRAGVTVPECPTRSAERQFWRQPVDSIVHHVRVRRVTKIALCVVWAASVAALTFAAVNVLWDAEQEADYSNPTAVAVAVAITATVPLLFAFRWPVATTLMQLAAVVGLTVGGFSRYVAVLGPCLAVPWLARALTPRQWGPLAVVVFVVGLAALRDEPYVVGYVAAMLFFFAPCLLAAVIVELVEANRRLRRQVSPASA